MSREIKFRAYQIDKEIMSDVINIHFKSKQVSLKEKENVTNTRPFDDVILMQYTGLKDNKGNEIYEGDVVYITSDEEYAIIEWDVDSAKFILNHIISNYIIDLDNWYNEKEIEVVDNIYENPKLLEV